ncbi:hydrogenase nickel incorporation protein HypB [Vibrio sp. Vf1514]|uniref:hydrogenase nickel incorporation protein HypB n=1 Tax=Vibrio sp. Vf1514 TaxID=3437381 RepID=UPI003F886C34
MCTVCGCGDSQIEHDHQHDHPHSHGHSHEHAHSHDHDHAHDHGEHHAHAHASEQPLVTHHHYYHQGDVHHHVHYHGFTPASAPQHIQPDQAHHEHSHHEHSHHEHSHSEHAHHEHSHAGDHDHAEHHAQTHDNGDMHFGRGEAQVHVAGVSQRQLLTLEQDILGKNNEVAEHNRAHFIAAGQLVLNLVSSPGSGKTTLLVETLNRLKDRLPCAVIEGDQQTSNDADRIRATQVPALQVNTGKGCHLDADMIHHAYHQLAFDEAGVLFIENVGNLVCPASFDLGERCKVAILSVTEGEDKPLKYPNMFAESELMIINKTDLLPYVNFDVVNCIHNAKKVNPAIQVIQLSATTGEGFDAWLNWLTEQRAAVTC